MGTTISAAALPVNRAIDGDQPNDFDLIYRTNKNAIRKHLFDFVIEYALV